MSIFLPKGGCRPVTVLEKENRMLRKEIVLLSTRLEKAESLLVENERLRALLELKNRVASRGISCRLLADNPTLGHRTLLVDCGKDQGVHRKDGVMGPQGVVGFVVKVFPDFSQVLWLEDSFFAMEGLLPGSEQKGVLRGMGVGHPMEMEYIPSLTPVQKGQAVVTSGEDGFFPPGEAIGFVKNIRPSPGLLFKKLDVVATENFSDLSVVYVLTPPREWDRSSLKWKQETRRPTENPIMKTPHGVTLRITKKRVSRSQSTPASQSPPEF